MTVREQYCRQLKLLTAHSTDTKIYCKVYVSNTLLSRLCRLSRCLHCCVYRIFCCEA